MKQAWLKGLRWRAPVRMRHAAAAGGLAAALAAALWLWSEGGASTFPVAYVVCSGDYRSESRAYRVDLLAGELTDVSEPLEWVGAPHHLDYDPVRSRLYFASMNKKWSPPMWPVTSLRAGGGEFEVAGRFPTSRENNLLEKARAGEAPPSWRMGMPEAYSVIVSPDGRELYVSYGGLSDTGMLAEVWDADTGEILRGLPSVISSEDPWSPDGNHVAVIWPSYDGEASKRGNIADAAFRGGVEVISTQTGEKSPARHLENNKGMHPPWGRIEGPLIYLFPWNMDSGELRVYDRDTGEVLSELEIRQLTGLRLGGGRPEVAALEGGRLIAVSVVDRVMPDEAPLSNNGGETEQGYVVLIDVMERREVTRTRVGERCTNAVVAYE